MSSGQHAPGRRPPGGQPGLALGRGVLLLVVAIVVGIVLLRTVPTPTAPGVTTQPTTPTTAPSQPSGNQGGTKTTTPTTLAPSKVTVLVANGTSVPAGATNMVNALKGIGYMTLVPYDTSAAATESAVYYEPGYAAEAETLAILLDQPASEVAPVPSPLPVTMTTKMTFNVLVVEGSALATRFANPVSLAKSTTSTTSNTTSSSTTSTI